MTVVFDFEGSLALARSLWSAADTVESRHSAVAPTAETALGDWTGPLADRASSEWSAYDDASGSLAEELRSDARSWAAAWARAMHRENEYRREDHTASLWRRNHNDPDWEMPTIVDAASPPQPSPPNFAPTAELQVF